LHFFSPKQKTETGICHLASRLQSVLSTEEFMVGIFKLLDQTGTNASEQATDGSLRTF